MGLIQGPCMSFTDSRWPELAPDGRGCLEPSALCGMSLAAAEMEIPSPTGPVVTVRSHFQWWEHFACWAFSGAVWQRGCIPWVPCFPPTSPVWGMVGCCSIIADWYLLIGFFSFVKKEWFQSTFKKSKSVPAEVCRIMVFLLLPGMGTLGQFACS